MVSTGRVQLQLGRCLDMLLRPKPMKKHELGPADAGRDVLP